MPEVSIIAHGVQWNAAMPPAIKLIDAEDRSCIYVPIMQSGRVVDSQGLCLVQTTNEAPLGHQWLAKSSIHSRARRTSV